MRNPDFTILFGFNFACFNLEKPITFQQQQLESQSEDERGDHLDGNHNRIAGLLFINFFALKTALFWKSGVCNL
jgi:hypothetical protein